MVVSLREKGVDLNGMGLFNPQLADVSLREKGVDLNANIPEAFRNLDMSPFVRREWI